MSNYLPNLIKIIDDLIKEAILNQYDPIVKIINSTVFTSIEMHGKNTNTEWEKTELINK